MVRIEIDPGAGYCFGVEQVMKTAEMHLQKDQELYGLGDIVHNGSEMQRLARLGLKTITHGEMLDQKPKRLLIRAHGEPPSTYELAKKLHIEIIDGTCPIVHSLQKQVRRSYEQMDRDGEQLVIFGKSDHPETIGLLGQVNGDALVISSIEDVAKVDPGKKIILYSQTTMDPDEFREIEKELSKRLKNTPGESGTEKFRSKCTICGQMKKRKPGLAGFAKNHELILFVSGKNSSNGKMLFEYGRSINPLTYWISDKSEVKPEWLTGRRSVGITGATSTSREQLESVMDVVRKFTSP